MRMARDKGRVLVTGAGGMLGSDLCPVLVEAGWSAIAADIAEFDITDRDATHRFVQHVSPTVIINCAAYTDVDGAEDERSLAFRVNERGARSIADAAAGVGAALVHISTDYVFDGEKASPYSEEDATNPINVYGASKLAGELAVREALASHYICRTAWLYGVRGKSFPSTMLRLAHQSKALRVVTDQTGSPTYTVHLAQALAAIVERPLYGTYHVVNAGTATWRELASEVFRAAGMTPDVIPVSAADYPTKARRPRNSVLSTEKLSRSYDYSPPDWRSGVAAFVRRWREEVP